MKHITTRLRLILDWLQLFLLGALLGIIVGLPASVVLMFGIELMSSSPVTPQELGKYAYSHSYRVTTWEDFNSPGYVPAFGVFNPASTDITTPVGFNSRYGGGAIVTMSCGPDWSQGAGIKFRTVGTQAACLSLCTATCKDGAWGSCSQVCTPRWIAPYSNKGTVIGERASNAAIDVFFARVGISGPSTALDLADAKMILSLYDGLITPANSGGVTAPPATGTSPFDDPGANAVPITDASKPCGLFQSSVSGSLRWYRNMSPPPNCGSPLVDLGPTAPVQPVQPVQPSQSPACVAWATKMSDLISASPAACGIVIPPGSIIYKPGALSTGSVQIKVVP